MSEINPLYNEESGHAEVLEIRRMVELEWPLEVSAEILPSDLRDKTIGDIGAGPNPDLGKLVKSRGGIYVAVDRNFSMLKNQAKENPNVIQANAIELPFVDKELDFLHTRFVIMNLPEHRRVEAIKELARCGKKNIIMDYNWEKFSSPNANILNFIGDARKIAELAGTDLNHGVRLKQLVDGVLPGVKTTEKAFNRGPIKEYSELAKLAKSMQGLAVNLQNMEIQKATAENRLPDPGVVDLLNNIKLAMERHESEFTQTATRADQNNVVPFTPPDIVAVTF